MDEIKIVIEENECHALVGQRLYASELSFEEWKYKSTRSTYCVDRSMIIKEYTLTQEVLSFSWEGERITLGFQCEVPWVTLEDKIMMDLWMTESRAALYNEEDVLIVWDRLWKETTPTQRLSLMTKAIPFKELWLSPLADEINIGAQPFLIALSLRFKKKLGMEHIQWFVDHGYNLQTTDYWNNTILIAVLSEEPLRSGLVQHPSLEVETSLLQLQYIGKYIKARDENLDYIHEKTVSELEKIMLEEYPDLKVNSVLLKKRL